MRFLNGGVQVLTALHGDGEGDLQGVVVGALLREEAFGGGPPIVGGGQERQAHDRTLGVRRCAVKFRRRLVG